MPYSYDVTATDTICITPQTVEISEGSPVEVDGEAVIPIRIIAVDRQDENNYKLINIVKNVPASMLENGYELVNNDKKLKVSVVQQILLGENLSID